MQEPPPCIFYSTSTSLKILLLTLLYSHYALNMHNKPHNIDGLGCHVLHGMSFLALTGSSITERFLLCWTRHTILHAVADN